MERNCIRCPNCGERLRGYEYGKIECIRCGCIMSVSSDGKIKRHDLALWFVFSEVLLISGGAVFFILNIILFRAEGRFYDSLTVTESVTAIWCYINIIHGLQTGSVPRYCYRHRNPGKFFFAMLVSAILGTFCLARVVYDIYMV